MTLSNGTLKYTKAFLLEIQDLVSVPEVNHTCHPNASVQLSCQVKNGTNPSFSWSMDGTPTWRPTGEILTRYQSVLRSVACTVRNQVSEETSRLTDITCPVPVSEPEVKYTCLPHGNVTLSCNVPNGTDLSYSWSVGVTPDNTSTSSREITIQQTVLINVTCTARNKISDKESKPTTVTCPPGTWTIITTEVMASTGSPATNSTGNSTAPDSTSDDCQRRCLLQAVTFGTVLLIVMTLPLVIGCLYTMPREKQQ